MSEKILVMNVNWLGDVILSAPVFENLRRHFPGAKIVCMAVPRVKNVVECIPDIDEIIIYDEDGKHSSIFGKFSLIRELRKHQFTHAFILHKSLTRALLAKWAGIKTRVGYQTKKRESLLTHSYPLPKTLAHRLDEYAGLLELFGIPLANKQVSLRVSEEELSKADNKLIELNISPRDFFVIIHPAANWNLKRWPKENFTLLIKRLRLELGAKVIVTGAKEEQALVEEIIRDLDVKPIVLVGTTTIKELAALMQKAKLVISADSGPMHLASAVGTSVVSLFGPTRPEITGPRGKGPSICLQHEIGCNKHPCYHLSCPDNSCMQSISVEEVLDAIKQIRN
jgi:heptosyltransferase-2